MSSMTCEDSIDSTMSLNQSFDHFDNQSHNHSHETKDNCSPFCTCQCCGISIISITTNNIFEEINNVSSNTIILKYTSLYKFNYQKGVWNPPIL